MVGPLSSSVPLAIIALSVTTGWNGFESHPSPTTST